MFLFEYLAMLERVAFFPLHLLYCDGGHFQSLFSLLIGFSVTMASDDIAQLVDALAKTHFGEGELSIKGLGLKLDNAASGQKSWTGLLLFTYPWTDLSGRYCSILHDVDCPSSGGAGPRDRAAPVSESFVSGGKHCGSGCCTGHRKSSGEQRHAPGTD